MYTWIETTNSTPYLVVYSVVLLGPIQSDGEESSFSVHCDLLVVGGGGEEVVSAIVSEEDPTNSLTS